MKKNIYIVGVGLIGGSFALDLKDIFKDNNIIGIDTSIQNLKIAKQKNIIDSYAEINDITNAYIIIIAVPVKAIIKILPKILEFISPETLVIDFGSTKLNICKNLQTHKLRSNFLAAHPIAGNEFSGPNAAVKGLFTNKTMIICENNKTNNKLVNLAINIFKDLKMNISFMDPKSHDKHIAYVSHLSHISSFMLGKTVIEEGKNEKNIFEMAGSGFESTVRLAKSSPKMWTHIFEDNKLNITEALDDYIFNLNNIRKLINDNKFDELETELKKINYIKNILNGINL
jgi:prephenate dehydrogenase